MNQISSLLSNISNSIELTQLTTNISISIDKKLLARFDKARYMVPRSKIISALIEESLDADV